MLFTRLSTFLLGLALLIPLAASFWRMAGHRPPALADVQQDLDDAFDKMDNGPDDGFSSTYSTRSVATTFCLCLSQGSAKWWSFHPRKWVGIAGMVCCLVIGGLWIYSVWFPEVIFTGDFSPANTGEEAPDPGPAAVDGDDSSDPDAGLPPPSQPD